MIAIGIVINNNEQQQQQTTTTIITKCSNVDNNAQVVFKSGSNCGRGTPFQQRCSATSRIDVGFNSNCNASI
jgi:hypothetical protein